MMGPSLTKSKEPAGGQYSKLVQLIERDIERDSVVDPATKERLRLLHWSLHLKVSHYFVMWVRVDTH